MSTDALDAAVIEQIDRARSYNDIPVTAPGLPYRSLGHLLEEQADRHETKVFLIFYSEDGQRREYTYREFYEEACRTANLFTTLGVTPGARIATLDDNHPDVLLAYFGAFLMGASIVPLDPTAPDDQLACIIGKARPALVCVRDAYVKRAAAIRSAAGAAWTLLQMGRREHTGMPHLATDSVRLGTRFRPARPVGPADEAIVMYSCRTGTPRGIVLEHVNLLAASLAIGEWHRLSGDQRLMCILPVNHVKGIVLSLLTPLAAGGGIVLTRALQPEKFFERIAADRVTVVSVDPSLLTSILKAKLSVDAYKLAHFRHLICASGPLTVDLVHKFEVLFKRPVIHAYGLAEGAACSCCMPIALPQNEHRAWLSSHAHPSVGTAIDVNEMMVQDPAGREVEEGVEGEIALRGHNVMRGYDGDPALTAAAFRRGWFMTGDRGYYRFDAEGRKFFFVSGRMQG